MRSEKTEKFPGIGEPYFNPKQAVKWIEQKPQCLHFILASDIFKELLGNAARPRQVSGKSCVKLCGFIEQCFKSGSAALLGLVFSEKVAVDLFNFFIEWNEQDQHRSMRLVQECLHTSISSNPDPEVAEVVKTRILHEILAIITIHASKPSVKSAFIALDHFLQKGILNVPDILVIYQHVSENHGARKAQDVTWENFMAKIFSWMELHHVCPVAGKLLVTMFTKSCDPEDDQHFSFSTWHRFMQQALMNSIDLLEPLKLYVMIPLFQSNPRQAAEYIDKLFALQNARRSRTDLDLNNSLWLAALEAGKKAGVLGEPDLEVDFPRQRTTTTPIHASILEEVLCHSSYEARTSAVSILLTSTLTTRPYTKESLRLIRRHLPAFYADTDAKFRDNVLGHTRNMINRILSAITLLRKKAEKILRNQKGLCTSKDGIKVLIKGEPDESRSLTAHEDIICWYLDFLKQELVPTASYQRHITSLKAMCFILSSDLDIVGQVGISTTGVPFSFIDRTWLRLIFDLIMDPFDDVRETAAYMIKLLLSTRNRRTLSPGFVLEELQGFCKEATGLASKTCRADHSDGVARSHELLYHCTEGSQEKSLILISLLDDLEKKLVRAEEDLATAVLEAPIHGTFAALRYIWGAFSGKLHPDEELQCLNDLQSRSIQCCSKIWQLVRHVLCDDSPEGHLPGDLEDVDGLNTKDLLSYSFRALHESSNLLRSIAKNAKFKEQKGVLSPDHAAFEVIGNLTFDELSQLRHRGALTTVTQTFTQCCQCVKFYPPGESDKSLLAAWYEGAIGCIYAQASTTRRSGGIPALVVGILSANASSPSLDEIMQELREIAQKPARSCETDGSSLPQVHALNCIKDVFKSSHLNKRAEPYLVDCFQVAASSLKSEIWAIRNCGLLLLRSLIDCLFGTSESKSSMESGWDGRTTKVAWHKFPALPTVLLTLLETSQMTDSSSKLESTAESVFPALDVIRRAGPPSELKDKLYETVSWYVGSHIWHVREIAARTLCSFLLVPDWPAKIRLVLRDSAPSANRLHGAVMTLKFLLERLHEVMPGNLQQHHPHPLRDILYEVSTTAGSFQTCSEVKAVYYEVIGILNRYLSGMEEGILPSNEAESEHRQTCPDDTYLLALEKSKKARAIIERELNELAERPDGENEVTLPLEYVNDVNVACEVLEGIKEWDHPSSTSTISAKICRALQKVCLETNIPQVRSRAVEILANRLDNVLCGSGCAIDGGLLLSKEELSRFWTDLQNESLDPRLANAILRVGGPILAAVFRLAGQPEKLEVQFWLRAWGIMMSEASRAENGFDTRISAISAIKSFISHLQIPQKQPSQQPDREDGSQSYSALSRHHLPYLFALYDFLNDDDDEIRSHAALAAAPLLSSRSLTSMEAGTRLLAWLGAQFGDSTEFRIHVACRMVGESAQDILHRCQTHWLDIETRIDGDNAEPLAALLTWPSFSIQMASALRFDDSLFVIEEQNLYVDEVRETERWCGVFQGLDWNVLPTTTTTSVAKEGNQDSVVNRAVLHALFSWANSALATLTEHASGRDDGPLGWTSKPEVYALCTRALYIAATLRDVCSRGDSLDQDDFGIGEALDRFVEVGQAGGVHGLLLKICGVEENTMAEQ